VQVFPNKKNPNAAGLIPADIQAKFNTMRDHVFYGVKNPKTQKEKDSGRHLKSTWLETHPGAQPLLDSDASVHLLKYPFKEYGKTVWDDTNGGLSYTWSTSRTCAP